MPLLFVLSAAAFVSAFTMRMLDPLYPAVAREFAVSVETAAMLASAFAFPYALSQPILGPIADAVGKARVIKACLFILGVALLLGSIAPRLEYLFLARVLAGIAGGGIIPVAFAIIGDRFSLTERQVALSRLVMASQIAILLGSVVGGIVATNVGWRPMFLWPAFGIFAVLAFTIRYLPARPGAVRHPISVARITASNREALSGPAALVCLGGVFVEGVALSGITPFLAGRLETRGLGGLREAGIVIGALSIGSVLFTIFVRQLLTRLGRAGLVLWGGGIVSFGLLGVAFSLSWQMEALALCITGFGFFMIHNSLQTMATELAPTARSSGVAMFAFIFFFGQAVGPVLFRGAFALLGPSVPIVLASCALLALAVWISGWIAESERTAHG